MIQTLSRARPEDALTAALFQEEMAHLRDSEPWYLCHDDLAAVNAPVYFHKFAAHAARHGLQFLAEADFFEMQDRIYPRTTVGALARFAGGNALRKEQYLDFIKGRRFRQTLLCREDAILNRTPAPGTIEGFFLSADVRSVARGTFRGPRGAMLKTDYAPAQKALRRLGKAWPHWVSFNELAASCAADQPALLGEILFAAYSAGLLELHIDPPRFVCEAGETPTASALARLQARDGARVTSLRHTTVELADDADRCLAILMDGTRTRADLAAGLDEFLHAIPARLRRRMKRAPLEKRLGRLARLALIER